MIKNYIKTAFRNLWKNKFYTALNVTGLAVGLAVGIIILVSVKNEKSYDAFNSKSNFIYRVNANLGTGNSKQASGISPAPILPYSINEFPEVKNAVRIAYNYNYS